MPRVTDKSQALPIFFGITMIVSIPVIWAISFCLLLKGDFTLFRFFRHMLLIPLIGLFLVSYFYSFLLAWGLLFLSIGSVETIEQLILSSFYPHFAITMFRWDKLLFVGVLYILGAAVERYIRVKKDELPTLELLPLLLFIIALFFLVP